MSTNDPDTIPTEDMLLLLDGELYPATNVPKNLHQGSHLNISVNGQTLDTVFIDIPIVYDELTGNIVYLNFEIQERIKKEMTNRSMHSRGKGKKTQDWNQKFYRRK